MPSSAIRRPPLGGWEAQAGPGTGAFVESRACMTIYLIMMHTHPLALPPSTYRGPCPMPRLPNALLRSNTLEGKSGPWKSAPPEMAMGRSDARVPLS